MPSAARRRRLKKGGEGVDERVLHSRGHRTCRGSRPALGTRVPLGDELLLDALWMLKELCGHAGRE